MKNCAVINDISGFGKCSLTVAMPVLSTMGIGVNPLVTGVFSNQTNYESYKSVDLTDFLPEVTNQWQKLGAKFDGILTGFLLSDRQSEHLLNFINCFKKDGTLLVVDPILGDDGELYSLHGENSVRLMRELCKKADVITPNKTELMLLSGEEDIKKGAIKLLNEGTKTVIVTGVLNEGTLTTYVFTKEKAEAFKSEYIEKEGIGGSFSGTGDIFSSFITGKMLCGENVFSAAKQATEFISRAARSTNMKNRNDGIDFELFLKEI